jgi:hypothetical protein
MIATLMVIGLIALITVVPVKLAADFTDGERTGFLASLGAAVIAPVLSLIVFRLLFGGFLGLVVAFIVGIAAYVTILRIPARTVLGFSVVIVALQVAVFAVLMSFGFNVGRMLLH